MTRTSTATRRRVVRTARALTAAGLAGVGVFAADVPASLVAQNHLLLTSSSTAAAPAEPARGTAVVVTFTTGTAAPDAVSPTNVPLLPA